MFEWKPEYSVNITSIDGQHRNLFQVAGELHAAMSAGKGKSILSHILGRLVQYTAVHFSYEERLMETHNYPDLEAHKAQHRALTRQVLKFQSDFEKGTVTVTAQLLHFLCDWLEKHIAGNDQKYAPYLRAKKVA